MEALYVVRHGETEWNLIDRFQGRLDSPLTPRGLVHAEEHGALLEREGVAHLIVSPLGRTRATADVINRRLNVSMDLDERLVERHCGAWEGLTSQTIERDFPDEWRERLRAPYYHRPPGGGENLADMLERVRPLLDTLHALPHRRIALVSHGMMGRVIVSHLAGVAPERAQVVRQPNDAVYRLSFDSPRPRCEYFRGGTGPVVGFVSQRVRSE